MSTDTSREAKQQAQLEANKQAYETFQKASEQPGGGINQPQYRAPSGGPTWADTPAGRALRAEYEKSGVVFNDRGDVIYNPADLGAAATERARAARGEPPLSKDRGTISPTYAAEVYTHSRRTQQAVRSNVEQVNRQRADVQNDIRVKKENIARLEAQQNAVASTARTNPSVGGQLDTIRREINQERQALNTLSTRLSYLDTARTDLAKKEQSIQKDITTSALSMGASRTTKGPVDTGAFSSSRTMASERVTPREPRSRVQAQTGVQEKLYANPLSVQDASTYTRPELYTDVIRQERPKAMQGVQDKLFVNPAYVTKEEQREVDQTRSIFSISLGATEPRPNTFAISLTEGAPQKPREITQAQFDAMSPQQQAVYNAEVGAWNTYAEKQQAADKKARAENLISWKESKGKLLGEIATLKDKGVKVLSALTTQGSKDIPINNAFKALTSGKVGDAAILGVGVASTIPEGYTLASMTSSEVFPTKETSERLLREEQRKQIERDPTGLSKFIYAEEKAAEKGTRVYGPTQPGFLTELQRSGAQYYSLVSSNIGSFFNLAYSGSSMIYGALGIKKLATAYEKIPRVYEAKPTGYEMAFNAPIVAASESIQKGNATAFLPTLQKEAVTGVKTIAGAPIGAIVGGGAGMFAVVGGPVPGKGLSKLSALSPIKYTKVIVPTEKGAERVASVFTIGYKPETSKYIGGFYGDAEKYKPFVSTPDFGRMGLERVTPPSGGSFDVYEFAAYNKQQSKPVYDLFRYGEKTGTVKPGTVEQQIIENVERQKQMKMKVKYERTLPVQIEGIPLRESEMTSMQQAISVIEKKGYTEPGKGSLITNMIAGWPKRAQGDIIDLEIKIPKNADKIMKDVENLRYRAEEAAKKGDYTKQQKLLSKAEKREAKVYEKGEAAVNYILSNVKMEPGRALARSEYRGTPGYNIIVGEAEGIPKVAEPIGLTLYHGTSPTSAQRILKQGLSFEKSRTSESTIFTSTDTRGAYGLAGVTLEIKMRPSAKILDVNEKGMAGWEDARIREYARKNKYDLIKNLMQGQQSFGEEVEIVRAENILNIKPTKSTIPKTIYDVPTGKYIKNNIRTISGEWINPTAKLERPGIKGEGKEVLNMIGYREKLTDKTAEMLGNIDRPFGEKWPKDTVKFRVKDESGKVVTYKTPYQSMAKFKAISGIQSAESMADDFSHTQEWKDKLLGGARLVKSPKSFRYDKDPLDAYMLTYRDVKYQFDKGDIAGAKESVEAALGMRKYYTGYDFIQGAKKFKDISEVEVPQAPSGSVSGTVKNLSGRAGVGSAKVASPAALTMNQPPDKSIEQKIDIATEKVLFQPIWKMVQTSKGKDFPVAADIRFGKEKGTMAYVQPIRPGRITMTKDFPTSPNAAAKTFSHETVHGVLNKLGLFDASEAFDTIEYGFAKGDVVKQLAPSAFNKGRLGYELTTDILLRGGSKARPISVTTEKPESTPSPMKVSSPLVQKSPRSMSPRSGLATSARSSMLSSRSGSTRMTSSYPSTRSAASPSKTAYSPRRSPMLYGVSPKSYGVSPRPSALSVSSPKSISSPRYGGSPYGASPYTTSPYGTSPLSPSKLSPLSPISPIVPEPLKPLFPPSPPKALKYRPPFLKNTTDKTKLSKKGQLEFFGSTHAASILGFRSKKKDFDYAKDLSGKAVQDIRKTDPIKRSPLNKKKSGMILSSPKRYFTPTKKQSKNFLKMRL